MHVKSTFYVKNLDNSKVALLCGVIYTPECDEISQCQTWKFEHIVIVHKIVSVNPDRTEVIDRFNVGGSKGCFLELKENIQNLEEDCWYIAEFFSKYKEKGIERINFCFFNTSQFSIPKNNQNKPLSVFFGSCYQVLNEKSDNRSTANAYIRACRSLFEKYDNVFPTCNILLGDQVYVDSPGFLADANFLILNTLNKFYKTQIAINRTIATANRVKNFIYDSIDNTFNFPAEIDDVVRSMHLPAFNALPDGLGPRLEERVNNLISERIRDRYLKTFYKEKDENAHHLTEILNSTNNYFLADDHEFWNNFPSTFSLGSTFVTGFPDDRVFKNWTTIANDYFDKYGDSSSTKTWGKNNISFFKLDTRTKRNGDNFCSENDIQSLDNWINDLNTSQNFKIGVLILAQPIFVAKTTLLERNIQSYSQFQNFWEILEKCDKNIVCLCGDVHYGRVSEYTHKNLNGSKIIEIIASPLKLAKNAGQASVQARVPFNYMTGDLHTWWQSFNPQPKVGPFPGRSRENFCILEFVRIAEDNEEKIELKVNHFEIASDAINGLANTKIFIL